MGKTVIALIAAVGAKLGIGLNGQLPWGHIKKDMAHFRRITDNSTLIMGRTTYESIGKPLPNREMFVVSSTLEPNDHIRVFKSVSAALEACKTDNIFFAGGVRIYEEGAKYADRVYLTMLSSEAEADTYFPKQILTPEEWVVIDHSHDYDSDSDVRLSFFTFERERA